MLNTIKNQMQIDFKKDVKISMPDGQVVTVSGNSLQKISKLYCDPNVIGFKEVSLAQQLDQLF